MNERRKERSKREEGKEWKEGERAKLRFVERGVRGGRPSLSTLFSKYLLSTDYVQTLLQVLLSASDSPSWLFVTAAALLGC